MEGSLFTLSNSTFPWQLGEGTCIHSGCDGRNFSLAFWNLALRLPLR